LRLAADEDADVAAIEPHLAVVLRTPRRREAPGSSSADDVVLLRVDVEHRHLDLAEVDLAPADLELAPDQLVVLVEVDQQLLRRLSRVVRAIAIHFSMRGS
jgi:hypothetical protein